LKADQEQRTAYFREQVNSGSAHCEESDQFEGGGNMRYGAGSPKNMPRRVRMGWPELILEFLRVIISWPVSAVVIAIIFQSPIRGLIDRVRSVSVPGIQLQAMQQPEAVVKGGTQIKLPPLQLPTGLTLAPDQLEVVKQAFQAERAAGRLWEYRYLNYFLARSTQVVLDWLVGLNQVTTADAFDAYWLPLIPDASQRNMIIMALQAHHLIEMDGPVIRTSEKGCEYAKWRGPLPPLPAPTVPVV